MLGIVGAENSAVEIMKNQIPVILSRRDVATATGLPAPRVYRAAKRGLIRPDFAGLNGAPFFAAKRLSELKSLLETPEITAQ